MSNMHEWQAKVTKARNEDIWMIRGAGVPLSQLGKWNGVSRERIRQIVAKETRLRRKQKARGET